MKNRLGWIFALLLFGAGAAGAQDAVEESVILEVSAAGESALPRDYGSALIFIGDEPLESKAMEDDEALPVVEETVETVVVAEESAPAQPESPYAMAVESALHILEEAGITYTPEEVVEAIWRGLFKKVPNFALLDADVTREIREPEGDALTWEVLPNKLGLLHPVYDSRDMSVRVQQALAEMQEAGVRGLVLDLRGAYTLPDDVKAMLMPERIIVKLTARSDWQLQGTGQLRPLEPVVVLVDEHTTLDGEMLAAVWSGRVALVGRETSGDPRVMGLIGTFETGKHIYAPIGRLQIFEGQTLKAEYNGLHGVKPTIFVSEEMEQEPVFEPVQPRLRKGKEISEEEIEDRALRDRTRKDVALRYATDILLGLRATGYAP